MNRFNIDQAEQAGELFGLINTTYSIGAILSGWFLAGPTVSSVLSDYLQTIRESYPFNRPTTLAGDGPWELVALSLLLPHSFRPLLHIMVSVFLSLVVS